MQNKNSLPLVALASIAFTLSLVAFTPSSPPPPKCFHWQAVIRDGSGKPISSRRITFEISIIQDNGSGTGVGATVYIEDHIDTTNQFGLVNLQIGCGMRRTGNFDALDWNTQKYWLSIRGNPEGGQLIPLGKSPILPTPGTLSTTSPWTLIDTSRIAYHNLILESQKEGGGSPNAATFRFGDNSGWKFNFGRWRESINGAANSGSEGILMTLTDKGNVGIGTSNPRSNLEVNGNFYFNLKTNNSSDYFGIFEKQGLGPGYIGFIKTADSTASDRNRTYFAFEEDHFSINALKPRISQITIELDATLNRIQLRSPLVQITGRTQTNSLEITGGGDLTEDFNIRPSKKQAPQPGILVSIDPNHPGQLMVTSEPYDKKLAGIISGANGINPGMKMSQKGSIADGDYPVALTGRVYVKADASFGAIQPGDQLTSSTVPGYAMKVSDYDRAQGTVIGKAMTSLEKGQGYVLVLVTLQ